MKKGLLNLVLHAHLPYVHHPEYEHFFEENWFFQAITECYLPLLNVFENLERDGVPFRLTLSLSPTLLAMFADDLLRQRFLQQLEEQIKTAEQEITRTVKDKPKHRLAQWYRRWFIKTRDDYFKYGGDLISAFRYFQDKNALELITTTATHAYLPLLSPRQSSVYNQIHVGISEFVRQTGQRPEGFWLPECGYYPGLETHLSDCQIRYFFTDTHAFNDDQAVLQSEIMFPLDCGNGVAAFARHTALSDCVWHPDRGYPANPVYREYYDGLGTGTTDLEAAFRSHIKYHCITGPERTEKSVYDLRRAVQQTRIDAQHFIGRCESYLQTAMKAKTQDMPVLVVPFDAELFGHWWFEGPLWLEHVLRLAAQQESPVQTSSCGDYLMTYPVKRKQSLLPSSWGAEGYSRYWINETNQWIYPHLDQAQEELEKLIHDLKGVALSDLQKRTLHQAISSVLLAQSSDWPFILKNGTAVEYATRRLLDYLARFNYLHQSIRKNAIDERYLTALETIDNIFPELNFKRYRLF